MKRREARRISPRVEKSSEKWRSWLTENPDQKHHRRNVVKVV
jgi:hypothetical protein